MPLMMPMSKNKLTHHFQRVTRIKRIGGQRKRFARNKSLATIGTIRIISIRISSFSPVLHLSVSAAPWHGITPWQIVGKGWKARSVSNHTSLGSQFGYVKIVVRTSPISNNQIQLTSFCAANQYLSVNRCHSVPILSWPVVVEIANDLSDWKDAVSVLWPNPANPRQKKLRLHGQIKLTPAALLHSLLMKSDETQEKWHEWNV